MYRSISNDVMYPRRIHFFRHRVQCYTPARHHLTILSSTSGGTIAVLSYPQKKYLRHPFIHKAGRVMIKTVHRAVLLLTIAQTLSAGPVLLKGTIRTSAGSGIAGVKVRLVAAGITGTSDDLGAFTLSGTGTHRVHPFSRPNTLLRLVENNLIITPFFENMSGSVDIFAGNGRCVSSVALKGSSEGKLAVPLPQFMPGLNIIRVNGNGESITQTVVCLDKANQYLTHGTPSTNIRSSFTSGNMPVNAADTIVAIKDGYETTKIAIDTLEKTGIEIVMSEPATGEMPLVYDKEWMGAGCPKPLLVADPTTLPPSVPCPDPFLMADGTTPMTTKAQWICRRAEIKAIIEKYETGDKPEKPSTFSATLSGNKINITCGEGGNSFTMSATISRPSGAPGTPIPAIINKGSLNYDFASKNIATISWNENDIIQSSGARTSGNFYKLYPQLAGSGCFIRWAWGISRIIDALEVLPEAKIDIRHLAVSGCSYQGKQALYTGAFDERIALTIVHESGGGGTQNWRWGDYCADRDKVEVENLHVAQGANWYAEVLGKYKPTTVSPNTLPFDQHELMGMIAPRALLCLESTLIARMGAEAAHMSAVGARRIYSALGIPERFGVSESNVNHCSWDEGYSRNLAAFIDKFLLGKDAVTGTVESKFNQIDTLKMLPWSTPSLK